MKASIVCCLTFRCLLLVVPPPVVVGAAAGRFRATTTFTTTKTQQKLTMKKVFLFDVSRGGARTAATATRNDASSSSTSPKTTSAASSTFSSSSSTTSTSSSSSYPAVTQADFPTLGTATIPLEVFNLVKAIVGAGVLALPAGIAAGIGNAPSALLPALLLLTFIGTISASGFYMIGNVCAKTRATSYRQAWSRSVGAQSSWIPALACLLVTFCSVSTYSMILAETIPAILQSSLFSVSVSRTTALLSVTTFILLPLCLFKSLRSLAPFSLLGIVGMLYTSTVMVVRWLSKSYATPTSPLRMQVPTHLVPRFGDHGWKAAFTSNSNIAILISMLSTAFMSHYHGKTSMYEK
jgi:Transmembrane amino acid transporter protein